MGHWVCCATSMVRWFYCHCIVTGKALRDRFLWKRSPWSPWTVTSCLDRAPCRQFCHDIGYWQIPEMPPGSNCQLWMPLSESFWHWSHKSTLCQSSNFRLQTAWDGPSELHSIVSSGRSILAWRDLSYTFSQLQTFSTRIPPESFLFHSSAF